MEEKHGTTKPQFASWSGIVYALNPIKALDMAIEDLESASPEIRFVLKDIKRI